MKKKYGIVIIVLVFLIVLSSISFIFYINLKGNKAVEVEATVKMVGNNYIIVLGNDGVEYFLNTNEEYNIGDRVDFLIKDLEEESNPKKGKVVKIDTISRNINFSIYDDNDDITDVVVESSSADNKLVDVKDSDVVGYFSNLDSGLDAYSQDKNIGDNLKGSFITIVDFLFNDGEIKGKTFDELSTTAKIKVLQFSFSIDDKIEKHFPGYKEEISTTSKNIYENVKVKVLELYLDITTSVCENDPNTCEVAKQGLSNLKNSFSLTWEFIKEISGIGISKLKEWYEVWKSC